MTTVYNRNGIPFDIDAIATDLNGKADIDLTNCTKPHITETYVNGTSWYRVWSDGWCEQGGRLTVAHQTTGNIVLLKSYLDTNYNIQAGGSIWSDSRYVYLGDISNITTSGFSLYQNGENGTYWVARGYIN